MGLVDFGAEVAVRRSNLGAQSTALLLRSLPKCHELKYILLFGSFHAVKQATSMHKCGRGATIALLSDASVRRRATVKLSKISAERETFSRDAAPLRGCDRSN